MSIHGNADLVEDSADPLPSVQVDDLLRQLPASG